MQHPSPRPVIIIGAGRHGILLAEKMLVDSGTELLGFLDSNPRAVLPRFLTDKGLGILGGDDVLGRYADRADFIVALGANLMPARRRLIDSMTGLGARGATYVQPTAYVAPTSVLGHGVVVLPHAVVNTGASIGDHTCINTASVVEHDCRVGANAFVQPRAVLGGSVSLGDNSVLGIGAAVRDGMSIGCRTLVGGGAMVAADIPDDSLAYGTPARVVGPSPWADAPLPPFRDVTT